MDDEKIVLMARLKVKLEVVEDMKNTVLALTTDSRTESGCLNYDVHQAIDDQTIFVWHETWANKTALDEHFAKPYFTEFFAKVEKSVAEPPQIILTRMVTEKA